VGHLLAALKGKYTSRINGELSLFRTEVSNALWT
jgi:hypothetical protein